MDPTPRQRIDAAEASLWTNVLGEPVTPEIERAVVAERERIAAWLDCTKDCQHATANGSCHRIDDFCSRYVADCIRRGTKP